MKIKLTIELEVPEYFKDMTDQEVHQMLSDEYVQLVHQSHLEHVLDMAAADDDDRLMEEIFSEARQHYQDWAALTANPNWSWEKV